MSKPVDYSKWDNIELSDDEDDVHPNIDKESWFRMRHRSRIEREENEEKDKAKIKADIEKADQRIRIIEHDVAKLNVQKVQAAVDASDSDDDDDLDDRESLETELGQLKEANAEREAKLEQYEKNKKWNVDNMFHVKEERTVVNPNAANATFTESGFVVEKNETMETTKPAAATATQTKVTTSKPAAATASKVEVAAAGPQAPPTTAKLKEPSAAVTKSSAPTLGPMKEEIGVMETYHEFTQRNAETIEEFMKCKTLEDSKEFLLKHGDILLCENASNYLLLASLEDEMNGEREKMKLTARQSQIVTNLAELAKTLSTHPGNVIQPFFARLKERKHLEDFIEGVNAFVDKLIKRAIVKKAEIDEQRLSEEASTDLHKVPLEERLGPGGLDPLEVIDTLPDALVEAFESRDVDHLKTVLMQMDPDEAAYHMKRCVDSGLWVANP